MLGRSLAGLNLQTANNPLELAIGHLCATRARVNKNALSKRGPSCQSTIVVGAGHKTSSYCLKVKPEMKLESGKSLPPPATKDCQSLPADSLILHVAARATNVDKKGACVRNGLQQFFSARGCP